MQGWTGIFSNKCVWNEFCSRAVLVKHFQNIFIYLMRKMDEGSAPVPLDPIPEDPEDRRLWIGNLDARVTEFVLLKLLQKHGSIEKFDLLFHRSGPLEGQPRGYAFVTYCTADYAKIAKEKLDGKIVGTKALSVKWAQNIGKDNLLSKRKTVPDIPALAGAKNETKLSKATTIQAIETKLKNMEAANSLEFEINKKPATSTNAIFLQTNKLKTKKFERHKYKPYFKTKF